MQMGIFRANPKGRVFPGGLLCQEARQGHRPLASLPFAHPIPESLRRNPVEFFNSLLSPAPRSNTQTVWHRRFRPIPTWAG
ncbi:MAG: hypothetical protein BWY57_02358 [Betaproteobacteria bacterium ADurb.Bin341]|nr:MAG: hypothetical protein BWY57_02358 [Betaproteobacteria bacterium ADurb.Bin341]